MSIQEKDNEYLLRPLIKNQVFTITEDNVCVSSPSTVFAQARCCRKLNEKDILSLYRKVLLKAKEQRVKISYRNHYAREIRDRWCEYENSLNDYLRLFNQFVEQAKVVQGRGIHYGAVDDIELKKLEELQYELQKGLHGNGVISRMESIAYQLKELERSLSLGNEGLSKIYI